MTNLPLEILPKNMFLKLPGCQEQKLIKKPFAGQSSVPDAKYHLPKFKDVQKAKFKVFGFKSDTVCMQSHMSHFFLLLYPLFCLFAFLGPLIFSFAGYFLGFISEESR